MKNAILLHGTYGNPEVHWFPWLARELRKHGYEVWIPQLPGADKPNIIRYNEFLLKKGKFDNETIVIGHSSGATEVLGLLQALPKDVKIAKALLVAGFLDNLNWEPLFDFLPYDFDFPAIKKKANRWYFFHSDNDPYVNISHGKKLHELLDGELIIMPGYKHFSDESTPPQKTFPQLLEKILV